MIYQDYNNQYWYYLNHHSISFYLICYYYTIVSKDTSLSPSFIFSFTSLFTNFDLNTFSRNIYLNIILSIYKSYEPLHFAISVFNYLNKLCIFSFTNVIFNGLYRLTSSDQSLKWDVVSLIIPTFSLCNLHSCSASLFRPSILLPFCAYSMFRAFF